jgi:hypothetical protein
VKFSIFHDRTKLVAFPATKEENFGNKLFKIYCKFTESNNEKNVTISFPNFNQLFEGIQAHASEPIETLYPCRLQAWLTLKTTVART